MTEKKVVHSLTTLNDTVRYILITPKWIYAACSDSIIRAWDHKFKKTKQYEGHDGWVYTLKIYENFLFSGGDDKTIRVWNLESTELLEELCGHDNGVTSLELADDNLSSGSYDPTITCWDIQ